MLVRIHCNIYWVKKSGYRTHKMPERCYGLQIKCIYLKSLSRAVSLTTQTNLIELQMSSMQTREQKWFDRQMSRPTTSLYHRCSLSVSSSSTQHYIICPPDILKYIFIWKHFIWFPRLSPGLLTLTAERGIICKLLLSAFVDQTCNTREEEKEKIDKMTIYLSLLPRVWWNWGGLCSVVELKVSSRSLTDRGFGMLYT